MVLLILLLIVLVIPLGIAMVMSPCPDCDLGFPSLTGAACLALLLVVGMLAAPQMARRHRFSLTRPSALLLIRDLDPPPRVA